MGNKILDFFIKVGPADPRVPTDAELGITDEEMKGILDEPQGTGRSPGRGAPGSPKSPGAPRPSSPTGLPLAQALNPIPFTPPPVVSGRSSGPGMPRIPTFPELYLTAKVPDPPGGYGVDKLLEIMGNPRVAQLPEHVRASSVLMALEVAGATLEQVVEDAVARHGALGDFETFLRERVFAITSAKQSENQALEEEINRMVQTHRARIAANDAEVRSATEQMSLWVQAKQAEERRLHGALKPFTADNPIPNPESNQFAGFKP